MLRDDKNLKAQVYIYSLRAREWITMATVDCSFDWDGSQSVVANDTLYFPPGPPGIRHSHILGLNLVSGELKEYPLFNFIIGYCEVYVSRVKGCLSLCCFKYLNEDYTSKIFDLWMMKQPDEWNSWEKVFSISVGDLYLHCIFETGKCLVTREEQLEFIDPYEVAAEQYKDGSDICKGSREGVNFLVYPFTGEAWTYAESLISPFGTFTSNDYEDVSRVEEKS
ncbi:F-box protein CPR1 [Bienertia sinuspersici]